jgi:hypothetical protein
MTSASDWPPAHVAFSHSHICAMLMTGTGMRGDLQTTFQHSTFNFERAKDSW